MKTLDKLEFWKILEKTQLGIGLASSFIFHPSAALHFELESTMFTCSVCLTVLAS